MRIGSALAIAVITASPALARTYASIMADSSTRVQASTR